MSAFIKVMPKGAGFPFLFFSLGHGCWCHSAKKPQRWRNLQGGEEASSSSSGSGSDSDSSHSDSSGESEADDAEAQAQQAGDKDNGQDPDQEAAAGNNLLPSVHVSLLSQGGTLV